MRMACKWLLGISTGVLIALILFTFVSWALFGATTILFHTLCAESGGISPEDLSLTGLFSNFIGSPMFYMHLADVLVLLCSSVALIITRQQSKS